GRGERARCTSRRSWGPALQCGHGSEAVENPSRTLGIGATVCCFNAATALRPWRTVPALLRSAPGIELQCGHGSEAVENDGRLDLASLVLIGLQCGHGSEAVENGFMFPFCSCAPPSFNAATALRPWRTHAG